MQLKILSWNIWIHGHFDQIARFLKESNADIIGLQEVKDDDPDRDVITYLKSLGYQHIFTPIPHGWAGKIYKDGPAIFSKYEIQETKTYILSNENKRATVSVDIKIGDKILHTFNTHLVHTHQQPSDEQNEQTDNLIKFLPNEHTIVMGDFNATPESTVIQKMQNVFVNTDPQSLPTWSVYLEGCNVCNQKDISVKLDYIFASKDIKTASFKVWDSKASDHLPVSVIVDF